MTLQDGCQGLVCSMAPPCRAQPALVTLGCVTGLPDREGFADSATQAVPLHEDILGAFVLQKTQPRSRRSAPGPDVHGARGRSAGRFLPAPIPARLKLSGGSH